MINPIESLQSLLLPIVVSSILSCNHSILRVTSNILFHYYFFHITGERPSLPELLRLEIPQHVATKYESFGILLLNDETGSRVDSIVDDCRGISERITTKILKEWIAGRGKPLTWSSLIETLRQCQLTEVAAHIHDIKVGV